jgi:hypothetical protein
MYIYTHTYICVSDTFHKIVEILGNHNVLLFWLHNFHFDIGCVSGACARNSTLPQLVELVLVQFILILYYGKLVVNFCFLNLS